MLLIPLCDDDQLAGLQLDGREITAAIFDTNPKELTADSRHRWMHNNCTWRARVGEPSGAEIEIATIHDVGQHRDVIVMGPRVGIARTSETYPDAGMGRWY